MGPFFLINSPLINYFFYPAPLTQDGPNVPLAGGFLFFFEDGNHSIMLPTFSDISDPENPVVNPNPLPLGAAGECPLFYLLDTPYYIVITDSSGDINNPIATISNYEPSNGTGNTSGSASPDNLITNGQFSYPITFWETTDPAGTISDTVTDVAWGWEFIQDPNTLSQNTVTFLPVNNQNIEGNPIYGALLTSISAGNEASKDFRTIIGNVNFMQGEIVTISMQLKSVLGGSPIVNVILEQNFGPGGSIPVPIPPVASFTINATLTKYIQSFTIPPITGETITPGNYLAIRLQQGLSQSCQILTTNVYMLAGEFNTIQQMPYVEQAEGQAKAHILGSTTRIETAGLAENYSNYRYNNGMIFPYAYTGLVFLYPKFAAPSLPDAVVCNNQSYPVNGYSLQNIPYSRLYNKIGNTFGGSGDLIVSATGAVVTFMSAVGAIQHSAYDPQSAPVTVANTVPGLGMGINCTISASNQILVTWQNNFAPDQTPIIAPNPSIYSRGVGLMSYWVVNENFDPNTITIATISAGSGSSEASAHINFNSNAVADYETQGLTYAPARTSATSSFLEFAAFTNNTRGGPFPDFNQLITFTVDGQSSNPSAIVGTNPRIVPFFSVNTLADNLKNFVRVIANPFQWTVTVMAVPTATSEYFFYSSASTDYYGWFKVDGVGTDPMIGGRTGVEIDILSTDTLAQVATAIAAATNSLTFSVPADTDLPALVPDTADSLVDWYIYL
jgi:hypothetical protein